MNKASTSTNVPLPDRNILPYETSDNNDRVTADLQPINLITPDLSPRGSTSDLDAESRCSFVSGSTIDYLRPVSPNLSTNSWEDWAERLETSFLEMTEDKDDNDSLISEWSSVRDAKWASPTPIPSDTDLFGIPSSPDTPDGEVLTNHTLEDDLQMSDQVSTNDEMEEPTQPHQHQVTDSDASSTQSTSSDSSLNESQHDLSIHHTPEAHNIDCLAQLDQRFIDTLDPVQKKVIRLGHTINKFMALHGKVSMIPYINVLNSVHLQLEEFMAPFLVYHKLNVTPQLRH
jgi:hypothetical protein